MNDIRLICLDMDGTLLADDHATVPARNIRALKAAAEKGAAVAIASGRAWDLLHGVHRQLPFLRYAILSNGAAVLDVERGTWICRSPMPDGARVQLIELLLEWELPFEVYAQGKNYIQADRLETVLAAALTPEFAQVLETCSQLPADLNAALPAGGVEKIHVFHVPDQRREELCRRAAAWGPLSVTTSFGSNMEFTAPGVNKGAAARALCARMGWTADQVMAFGDAGNDLELLSWAGWSFAMANASEPAKRAARHLTASNGEAGVAQGVERYFLET